MTISLPARRTQAAPAYAAIVLAGDRSSSDPIATARNAPCKSLSVVGDTPLLERVVHTLRAVKQIDTIILVGPAQKAIDQAPPAQQTLDALLQKPSVRWLAPAASPSASAAAALATLDPDQPALLTSADHALLTITMIEPMLDAKDRDLSVGMVDYAAVRRAYPNNRRTAIRLGRAGGYCGCNLFAIHTAAGRRLVADWQRVEKQRKHPARVIAGMLGWFGIARYALGRLSLEDAFARLSRRTRLRVRPVLLSEPEAAIDVDSLADLQLVESILAKRASQTPRRA